MSGVNENKSKCAKQFWLKLYLVHFNNVIVSHATLVLHTSSHWFFIQITIPVPAISSFWSRKASFLLFSRWPRLPPSRTITDDGLNMKAEREWTTERTKSVHFFSPVQVSVHFTSPTIRWNVLAIVLNPIDTRNGRQLNEVIYYDNNNANFHHPLPLACPCER